MILVIMLYCAVETEQKSSHVNPAVGALLLFLNGKSAQIAEKRFDSRTLQKNHNSVLFCSLTALT